MSIIMIDTADLIAMRDELNSVIAQCVILNADARRRLHEFQQIDLSDRQRQAIIDIFFMED